MLQLDDVKQPIDCRGLFCIASTPVLIVTPRAFARQRQRLYHNRSPLDSFECLSQAFYTGIDLVGWAEIENQNVIIAVMDQL